MLNVPDKGFTHGGRFHADDVFSTALLQILNPDFTVTRGFTVPENFDGIVYDIGDGEFDHHAKGSPVRESGVPYAAFGLLWRKYGAEYLGSDFEAKRFDDSYVSPLDLNDNTGAGDQLANYIASYNPAWDSNDTPDDCFANAVAIAKDLLWHKLENIKSVMRAEGEVKAALCKMKGGIVCLDRFAPWKQQVIQSRAKFVVYPSQRGGFCAQAVPMTFGTQALRIPFPAHWAGAAEAELPAISGIETLRFCHAGRFMVTTGTKEDAIAACHAAQELQGE